MQLAHRGERRGSWKLEKAVRREGGTLFYPADSGVNVRIHKDKGTNI